MGRFLPLYVRRSDGKLETVNTHKRKEPNQPTPEQLDMKPDAKGTSDYYREVPMDEPKHLDWRRKLGGMLARELGWSDSGMSVPIAGHQIQSANIFADKGYILVAFPEFYRLFEHVKTVKKVEGDGKTITKTKTHAGGGNDRQDAYLYGHPMGRKKRFRSPADYFPHLLWLVTDETGDPDNCSCKICCPEEFDEKPTSAAAKETRTDVVKPPLTTTREELKPISAPATGAAFRIPASSPIPASVPALGQASARTSTPLNREPPIEAIRRIGDQGRRSTNSPLTSGTPLAAATPIVNSQRQPNGLPQPRTIDQALDLRYGAFTFRQGEMVWFNRGAAWGLGVIIRRWKTPKPQAPEDTSPIEEIPNYSVQPLSWPGQNSGPLTITKDDDLRPWLAWSVPGFTCQRLNEVHVTYDTADWRAIQRGDYGHGEIGVDGSILAAKAIDSTYSTFSLIGRSEPQPGVTELRWTGLYVGAEKVWVGDPVRLRAGPVSDVLVVREIRERSQTSAFNAQSWTSIQLVGDVYTLQEVRYNNNRTPILPGSDLPGLPPRMLEDLRQRNPYTINGNGLACLWKQVRTSAPFELKDIKGRWYEATLMLPILQGRQDYNNKASQGQIKEAGLMMNGRHDCNSTHPIGDMRKPERRDALGKAIPENVRIVDGIDPPIAQFAPQQQSQHQASADPNLGLNAASNIQAAQPQHTSQQQQGGVSESGAGFEEFMDLDGMGGDSIMPGLDQHFGGQNFY